MTGRGRVIMRAKAEIESGQTHDKIVITEIPYNVNKAEPVSYTHLDVYKRQTCVLAQCGYYRGA